MEEQEQKFSKKFLFIDLESLSGDLAWQIKKEGNEVRYYVASPADKDVYDGFLEKVDDWKQNTDWADVIVFGDNVGFGNAPDTLRAQGKLVVGGSQYTDKLELDREFGQSEMKAAGMTILPHWDFTDFETAVQFIKENPGRYVFKPSGNISSDQKGILFIGHDEDGKDLIEVLEHNKKVWSRKIKRFQLQKFAQGVEIAVGAFFNGKEFITPININFEHKKLFPGDIGPATGEMGTLMFWSEPNALFNATLAKMLEHLRESNYVGYVDINCIANSKGVYPLEFTTRFGYPTINIQMEGVISPWGEFLHAIAKGEKYDFKTKKGFQVGVVVAVPPFPYDDKKETEIYRDSSIIFKKPNTEGVHLGDVKLVDGDWHLAGESGYAIVVTGSNGTVEEARHQAYRRLKNILLQNMFYRTDIGYKWYMESDQLQTWG
ncbi:MAG: phosphoribosylglycinamide synthetase C domain-containing protein, partial [Patescibacteria group bacterium]